ncbi:MAG: hypothetical protein EBS53_00855 [Bacteroidetes bacterium]|nr:hypothetical protein [Bacteroidota bacterium]
MMLLGEVRNEIARVVDNGVPPADPRVIQRINQAQRRLYAIRAWTGVLAKYKVDLSSNIFTKPEELETIHHVTAYTGSGLVAGPVLLSDDANAFVHHDGDLIPLLYRPIGSTANQIQYQVDPSLNQSIASVVVTGKKRFVAANQDSDPLIIQDLEALKLMVMALWREENNQLELAGGLQLKAVEHLTFKTDMAVEVARRLAYQSRLSTATPGTMGFVRSRLALDLEYGLKIDDGKLFDLVNKAQDFLISKKRTLLSSARYGVKDDEVLPVYSYIVSDATVLPVPDYQTVKLTVLSLMMNSISNNNQQVTPDSAAKYEAEAVKSLEEDLMVEMERKRHNEYTATLSSATPNTFGYIKARMALELPLGLRLSNQEIGRIVNRAEETLITLGRWAGTVEELKVTVPSDGLFYLPYNVESILSATLNNFSVPVFDQTYDYSPNGPGFETADDNTGSPAIIARGERIVSNQRMRVYFARGNWNDSVCARLLVKRRHIDHTLDSEYMLIRNYPALHEMALSLSLQSSDQEKAKYHETQALQLLRSELEQNQGGQRASIQIQGANFSMGEIGALV